MHELVRAFVEDDPDFPLQRHPVLGCFLHEAIFSRPIRSGRDGSARCRWWRPSPTLQRLPPGDAPACRSGSYPRPGRHPPRVPDVPPSVRVLGSRCCNGCDRPPDRARSRRCRAVWQPNDVESAPPHHCVAQSRTHPAPLEAGRGQAGGAAVPGSVRPIGGPHGAGGGPTGHAGALPPSSRRSSGASPGPSTIR
jgi:hypothetical protein